MSEEQRQQVSALMDGELSTRQSSGLLSSLEQDTEQQALWERYHLIGNALRGDAIHADYRCIAERVHRSLAKEPTVLAPAASRHRGIHRGINRSIHRFAPFAGAALAAGTAFLAIFAVPGLFNPTADAPPDAQPQTMAAVTSPPDPFRLDSKVQRWRGPDPAVERRLDRFLVTHQEKSPTSGMTGILPYATVVSYEPGR